MENSSKIQKVVNNTLFSVLIGFLLTFLTFSLSLIVVTEAKAYDFTIVEQTHTDTSFPIGNPSQEEAFGNCFIVPPSQGGLLHSIEFYLSVNSQLSEQYYVSLYSSSFGGTPHSILYEGGPFEINTLSTTPSWVSHDLSSSSFTLQDSGNYCVVISQNSGATNNNLIVHQSTLNPITTHGRSQYPYFGSNWSSSHSSIDLTFAVRGMDPVPVCGNSLVESPPETCDDGNLTNGDGCSSICAIQTGYVCSGEPSSCYLPVVGDGIIDSPEVCDDGNTLNGDGCDSSGNIEVNYECTGEPSTCLLMVQCFETCDLGSGNEWFPNGTTCGSGVALDYALSSPPVCAQTVCYSTCDDGVEYATFDNGTTCGSGAASLFPEDSRPYCADYYTYACNDYYYNLCTDQTSCESLGADFDWTSTGCQFLPDGSSTEATELDALNVLIDKISVLQSQSIQEQRLQSFVLPFALFLFFFSVLVAIIRTSYRYFFKRKSDD